MPITTTIDPIANLITYRVWGDMTLAHLQGAVEGVASDPAFKRGMNSLWNLKDARIAIAVQELPDMLGHLAGISPWRGKGFRAAILVRSNEDFGLSSLLEMNAHVLPFEVRVFRNSQEALDWVTPKPAPRR